MSTIQFGGVVSGLNTQSIITALVAAESQPLTAMQTKEATLTAQKAAYGQLGTADRLCRDRDQDFTVTSAGASRAATSSDNSVFTATASPNAAVSQYQISVQRLATATVATSTGALGTAITGNVNTSKTLANANLATPITAGQHDPHGGWDRRPGRRRRSNDHDRPVRDRQSDERASDAAPDHGCGQHGERLDRERAAAALGQRQHARPTLSPSATRPTPATWRPRSVSPRQGATNVQNATITGAAYLDPTLQSLNLPGSVTAGQISAIVDGVIVHYTVGDPATTTLDQLMAGFGQAIQSQLQAGGVNSSTDPTAAATFSVANNRLQLSIAGAVDSALDLVRRLRATRATPWQCSASPTPARRARPIRRSPATTNLGVTRMLSALDTSGIAGSDLDHDRSPDDQRRGHLLRHDQGLAVDGRQPGSTTPGAGVIASVDRTNDQIVLTKQATGAVAIDIADTSGNLGAALKLAPGTTNAQQVGQTAQLTVNGRLDHQHQQHGHQRDRRRDPEPARPDAGR